MIESVADAIFLTQFVGETGLVTSNLSKSVSNAVNVLLKNSGQDKRFTIQVMTCPGFNG